MIGLLLTGMLAASPVDDPLPTPEALVALFRENRDTFRTVNLQWKREHRYSDDWRLIQTKRLEEIDARLETLETSQSQIFQALQKEAQGLRNQIANQFATVPEFRAFLIDGARFMIKVAPANWGMTHTDEDWLMPEKPVTPATMERSYAGFTIYSYQNDPGKGYRSWTVVGGQANLGYGSVCPNIQIPETPKSFPPFVTVLGANNMIPWHPIDTILSGDPSRFQTVGQTRIDDHDVVILEERTEGMASDSLLSGAYGDRYHCDDVTRLYVDPARGALPLRIEWDTEHQVDGKPRPRPKGYQPARVIEVTEIVAVPGAGFYPSRSKETFYVDDPKIPQPVRTAQKPDPEVPSVALEETLWHVGKVEAKLPPGETFALEFPPDAYYYNQITGYSGRVKDEHVDTARLPWTLCGILVAGWAVYGLIAVVRRLIAPRRNPARASAA